MTKAIKCKDFCLSDFGMQKVQYLGNGSYNAMRGKEQTHIGFFRRGNCAFSLLTETVECHAGDLVYIPEGTRYFSHSQGDPEMEYYIVQISFRSDANGRRFDRQFAMQKIEGEAARAFGERLPALYALLETGEEMAKLKVLSAFYPLFVDLLPQLQNAESTAMSSTVRCAVDYIEAHLCEDFTVADIARACLISESRLYHLFRTELHITPTAYKNEQKILHAVDAIKTGYQTVEEISASLGFQSATYFRRLFKEITHMTPTEYRARYAKL